MNTNTRIVVLLIAGLAFLLLGIYILLGFFTKSPAALKAAAVKNTIYPTPIWTPPAKVEIGLTYQQVDYMCDFTSKPDPLDRHRGGTSDGVEVILLDLQPNLSRVGRGCHGRFLFQGGKLISISR